MERLERMKYQVQREQAKDRKELAFVRKAAAALYLHGTSLSVKDDEGERVSCHGEGGRTATGRARRSRARSRA